MRIRAPSGRLSMALCATTLAFATNPSRAAEWSVEPSVDLRTEYSDNFNFTPTAPVSVWGIIVSPAVAFSGATETLNVTGILRLRLNRYFDEEGLDTDDHIVSVRSTYSGDRDTFGLTAESVRDSTLESELLETGLVLRRQQRKRFAFDPSWRRSLTESTSLAVAYHYADVRYASTEPTGAADYRDQAVTVGMQSRFGERDVASATAYYSRYDSSRSLARTYGVDLGYERALSEATRVNLIAGIRRTRNTLFSEAVVCDGPIVFGFCIGNIVTLTSDQTETSTGYVFAAAFETRWETASLGGRISHQFTPSGVGALVETDRIELTWRQDLSPTVTWWLAGAAYETTGIGSLVSGTKSRYFSIEPKVTWKVTEECALSAGYAYRHSRNVDEPTRATSNVGYVVVTYAWPKISVSR